MKLTWTRLGFLGFMIPLAFWGIAAVGWGLGEDGVGGKVDFTIYVVGNQLVRV